MDKNEIYKKLTKSIKESKIMIDEEMSKHTSFKIGGKADIFIKVKEVNELKEILKFSKENNIPVFIMGNGSNLLVKDNGIRGITLQIALNNYEIINKENDILVNVEAGVKLGELSVKLQNNEIAGFEFASGIPGTIGGAIRMNAGAYGKEFKDIVQNVTYINKNLEIITIPCNEAEFTYRNSKFGKEKENVIISTCLKLEKGNIEEIKEKINEYKTSRIEKQPIEYPNGGSTFKRGEDFITAKLIDEAGLKGYTIGGAQVSTKHAGFIINKGNATAKDVLNLVEYVKKVIYEKFQKNIELEIEVVGE